MGAVEYLKAKQRMLKSNKEGSCNISCNICPFYMQESTTGIKCDSFEVIYPEKAVAIVEKWAAEHPVKTRQSEFLKMFPNAPLMNYDGIDIIDIPPCFLDTVITDECSCKKMLEIYMNLGNGRQCVKCKKDYWLTEVKE